MPTQVGAGSVYEQSRQRAVVDRRCFCAGAGNVRIRSLDWYTEKNGTSYMDGTMENAT